MAKSTTTTVMELKDNKKHWETVCKIGQGADCCKYLVMGKGFECMKEDPENKKVIDDNWAVTPHVAQGDNCEGYAEHSKKKVELVVEVSRNQNDKRYEDPFEDDGAYADEIDD